MDSGREPLPGDTIRECTQADGVTRVFIKRALREGRKGESRGSAEMPQRSHRRDGGLEGQGGRGRWAGARDAVSRLFVNVPQVRLADPPHLRTAQRRHR